MSKVSILLALLVTIAGGVKAEEAKVTSPVGQLAQTQAAPPPMAKKPETIITKLAAKPAKKPSGVKNARQVIQCSYPGQRGCY